MNASYADDILPELIAILEAVDGIGNVYEFPQHSAFIEKHKELFVTDENKFHVWWPSRVGWEATGGLSAQVFRRHTIELIGHYALSNSNESEKEFQSVIENIANRFDRRSNFSLDDTIDQHLPAQMEKSDVMFAGVLCHKAIIRITAEDEATQPWSL